MLSVLHSRLATEGALTLTLRVRPGARVSAFKAAMADGTLKVDVAAAPEDGEANGELVRFLAEEFGVPRGNVSIVTGHASRRKVVTLFR